MISTEETIHTGRDLVIGSENPGIDRTIVPSRGRTLEGQASAGASGRQPSGEALPSLILGEHDLPSEHAHAALSVVPLAAVVNTALSMRVRRVIASQANDPATTVSCRIVALETFKSMNERSPEYQQPWADRFPADSPCAEN